MKAWGTVDAKKLVSTEVVEAIRARVRRIWEHSRCRAWVMWSPAGDVYVVRADDADQSRICREHAGDWLVGVYGDVPAKQLHDDLAQHVKDHANEDVG